jgi:hypothetical protein
VAADDERTVVRGLDEHALGVFEQRTKEAHDVTRFEVVEV